ncbi:MAG TPA: carbohydrate ABC transporter permease [Paenibacillus sp.]|nr:carbohydrate ABC transporter permease [Paenibacillus sp.]
MLEANRAERRPQAFAAKPVGWAERLGVHSVLIAVLFVSVLPVFWIVMAGVKPKIELNANPFALPKAFTLDNLIAAWTVGKMGVYFWNSVFVAVPRVLVIVGLAALAGYAFAKLKFPGRNALFYFFLFGLMIPIQAMIIPLYYTMQNLQLINTYWALILPSFGLAMPFAIFMMRAFFRDVHDELMDAAKIDGCGDYRTFLHIMLPLMKPALTALIVFEFCNSWNDFLLPLLFVYQDAYRTLPLGLMYFSGEYTTNQTLVAAGVTIAILPIITVYLVFQRTFIEGIAAGSVKG